MAVSAHAYVRGSTTKFYEWLEAADVSSIPQGPPIWICGDCHLGNLGPIANSEGEVEIGIRDLDQTVIGNPALDLIRLGLSLASAARGSDLSGVTTAKMLDGLIDGYQTALVDDGAEHSLPRPKCVQTVVRKAERRTWAELARERIEDAQPTIPLGKRFWPLSLEERDGIDQLFATEEARQLVTMLENRRDGASITVLDAAYWVKGCSSLGRLRFALLVGIGKRPEKGDLCLIDIKEAVTATAPRYGDAPTPRDNARRVVAGACHLSPSLGKRMLAARLLDKSVVVRELLPQDLKVEVGSLSPKQAVKVARYLAAVIGRAHGRQMDGTTIQRWREMLARMRPGDTTAPSWLWRSVVELIGAHEPAYLDHCRRYAIAARALQRPAEV